MRHLAVPILLLVLGLGPALAEEPEIASPPYSAEQVAKWREITTEAMLAFAAKEFDRSLALHAKALEVAVTGTLAASSAYNVACCHALGERSEEALDWLGKAVGLGFCDLDHIETDEDLTSLRETEPYRKLVQGLAWNDEIAVLLPDDVAEDARLPVLVALHEGGGSEADAVRLLREIAAARGAMLVAPRAPFTLSPGDRFAWKRDSTDDAPALRKIEAALDRAAKEHAIDPAKVTVLGLGSRAGYLAYRIGLSQPERFSRIVAVNGWFNRFFFPDFYGKAREACRGVLIVHAREHPDAANARDAAKRLQAAKVAVKLVEVDGSGLPDAEALAPVGAFLGE